jgi:hypothetical protein
MERVHGIVDLSGEDFETENLRQGLRRMVEEWTRTLLNDEDDRIALTFPIYWAPDSDGLNGNKPTDPLTVYVHLPLAKHRDPVFLKFNLRESLTADWDDWPTANLALLRDAFRGLADEINAEIVRVEAQS